MSTVASSSNSGKKRKAEVTASVKASLRMAIKSKRFRTTKFVSSEAQCRQVAIMVLSELKQPDCFEMVEGKITPTECGKQMAETNSAYILKLLNETRKYARTQIKTAF